MRSSFIIFIIVLILCHAHALASVSIESDSVKQVKSISNKKKTVKQPDYETQQKNYRKWHDDCTFTDKYSLSQRLKMYPFSKAVKVVTVSFHSPMDPPEAVKTYDPEASTKPPTGVINNRHTKRGVLDSASLVEIKTLNDKQIESLTNLIYNTGYKKPGYNPVGERACFEPRNAFIFYDKKGRIFDVLNICFGCQRAESITYKFSIGTLCNQKYDLLRKFLIGLGIKTGTMGY